MMEIMLMIIREHDLYLFKVQIIMIEYHEPALQLSTGSKYLISVF